MALNNKDILLWSGYVTQDPEVKTSYQYVVDLKQRVEEEVDYRIQISPDKVKTYHINMLKQYFYRDNDTQWRSQDFISGRAQCLII